MPITVLFVIMGMAVYIYMFHKQHYNVPKGGGTYVFLETMGENV